MVILSLSLFAVVFVLGIVVFFMKNKEKKSNLLKVFRISYKTMLVVWFVTIVSMFVIDGMYKEDYNNYIEYQEARQYEVKELWTYLDIKTNHSNPEVLDKSVEDVYKDVVNNELEYEDEYSDYKLKCIENYDELMKETEQGYYNYKLLNMIVRCDDVE